MFLFVWIQPDFRVFPVQGVPIKNALSQKAQGEHMSVVPPEFGNFPALNDAKTSLPDNGGTTVAAYSYFSPMLRDDFSDRFTETYTNRFLSWHLPAGYCFPSLQFSFIPLQYSIPFWECQESGKPQNFFF